MYDYSWLKISLAMQGKRTPRQVASRVQKYFEKLKRFGVGVNEESVPSQWLLITLLCCYLFSGFLHYYDTALVVYFIPWN